MSRLHLLSQESTACKSIQVAKQELSALPQRAQSIRHTLALPDQDMLVDCESAADLIPASVSNTEFIENTNGGGKLHRVFEKDL